LDISALKLKMSCLCVELLASKVVIGWIIDVFENQFL
jgi:hypothetical protein